MFRYYYYRPLYNTIMHPFLTTKPFTHTEFMHTGGDPHSFFFVSVSFRGVVTRAVISGSWHFQYLHYSEWKRSLQVTRLPTYLHRHRNASISSQLRNPLNPTIYLSSSSIAHPLILQNNTDKPITASLICRPNYPTCFIEIRCMLASTPHMQDCPVEQIEVSEHLAVLMSFSIHTLHIAYISSVFII